MSSLPVRPEPADKAGALKRVLPANPRSAALIALGFTALLYLVELIDLVIPGDFDHAGIRSRTVAGLDGILWAPLLHHGWAHLVSNTVPILLFGFLVLAAGSAAWIVVTTTIWVVSGLGVWLTGPPNAITVGASGLAFGWLAYLLVRGVFNRSFAQLIVAGLLLVLWGGMLWGVLPGDPGISWQGHLFGAAAGVLAAWAGVRSSRRRGKPEEPTSTVRTWTPPPLR